MNSKKTVESILNEAAKDFGYTDFEEMICIEDGPYNPEDIEELSKLLIVGKYGWNLSRETMPEFDGQYLVAGWVMQPCGAETKFQIVAECKMNQWVKNDPGHQFTFWRHLPLFPELKNENQF